MDWLCAAQPVHAVVRFNGGAQAGHNVVLPDGRRHTFAQIGSGSFLPGVRTHLSRFIVVDPLALAVEADHLASLGVTDAFDRLTVGRRWWRPRTTARGEPGPRDSPRPSNDRRS